MKLDQKLWHEIRSYMEESETQLSEATQGPPWEQTADIKFRQMMALVPLRKVLPTIKSDLQQPDSVAVGQTITGETSASVCGLSSSASILQ